MLSWLTATIPPRPLGLTRMVVGAAAAIRALVALPVLLALTDETTMRAPYLDWLPEPNLPLVIAIVMIWLGSAALLTVGWRVSITGPLLLGAIVTNLVLDQQTYSNHLYLMAWLVLLLSLADAGAGLSIGHDDRPVVRWPVLLIMLQASIVYGFSALTKINDEFLTGEVLARVVRGGLVPFPETLRTPALLSVLAVVVIGVELFIAVMLWSFRFRSAAFVLGLGLHISITLLMDSTVELTVFSLEMLAIYPLFDALTAKTRLGFVSRPYRSELRSRGLL